MNRTHVIIDKRHIKKIFAVIAQIGNSGTQGTINGSFVLELFISEYEKNKLFFTDLEEVEQSEELDKIKFLWKERKCTIGANSVTS